MNSPLRCIAQHSLRFVIPVFAAEDVPRIEVNVVTAVLLEVRADTLVLSHSHARKLTFNISLQVAEWWQEKILTLYEFIRNEVISQPHLFPDLALLRGLPQPLVMALHRHASSGSYLHLFRMRSSLRLAGFSPMFIRHVR